MYQVDRMGSLIGSEQIVNPLQNSSLNKKGLCDYVINVASGCLHGCTFCYVPSTPAIRTNQLKLIGRGVEDPQLDWGNYLFIRDDIPEKLDKILKNKRVWRRTEAGKGIVLLCSGTDPYQNSKVAAITREIVKVLIKYQKPVRVLTRSPLWVNDLDILVNPLVSVGMSLPYLDDDLSKKIEPKAPVPSIRYKALLKGKQAKCRLFIAMAPTPPQLTFEDFVNYFRIISRLSPEVVFWEPINARGCNGKRMLAAGLKFVEAVMHKSSWAENFIKQWEEVEMAAENQNLLEKLHIWPDPELQKFTDAKRVQDWLYKPSIENWYS